jgi:DNA modification methylase
MTTVRVLEGDCRTVLRTLPAESVHCVVTSPPYYGLRDYGVRDQIGLEASPTEFIAELVAVFDEVARVLRKDGTLWLNMGDSYASGGGPGWQGKNGQRANRRFTGSRNTPAMMNVPSKPDGFKRKDMMGMPWRLAFALQDAGWYLRQDIIWSKPNPMPESCRDRCTKSHEYIFLLSKSRKYHFDAEAIREPSSESTHARLAQDIDAQAGSARANGGTRAERPMKALKSRGGTPSGWDTRPGSHRDLTGNYGPKAQAAGVTPKAAANAAGNRNNASFAAATSREILPYRNKRSVWTIGSRAFKEAHFATFPEQLVEPCILAGCPEDGLVLDPFGGSGTTGIVAHRLKRNAILIELNPAYADIARRRIDDARQLPLLA